MPEIRQLSPSIVNKIAAGEVIERPASIVKELLENAVDAGARRIDVSVEQGGAALVRVADDGCGIDAQQLPLAVASHATSKIRSADDLFRIGTLGFRGEALASIAEVSQLRLRSRTVEVDAGYEIEVVGGEVGEVVPCGAPRGTTVEVRNLFYNTPVRRKFLRTTQTEMGHASEAFTRVALAHPEIHFTLRHNNRSLFDLPPTDSWRERIATFFGSEVNDHLIWVENVDETARLSGYVADPGVTRSNNRLQYLLLNGRFIRDRSLQHALGEAYRGLLMTGRYPVAFLRLEVAPGAVDVNVHPTKLEVRFQDGGRIYSHVLGTLRAKFLSTDLTAKVSLESDAGPAGEETSADPSHMEQHRQEVSAWARGETEQAAGGSGEGQGSQNSLPFSGPRMPAGVPEFRPFPGSGSMPVSPPQGQGTSSAEREGLQPQASSSEAAEAAVAEFRGGSASGLQLHNRYLVTENDEGMVIIDQHALHERVLYEQLREKVLQGQLETQRLLVPEPVSLTPAEAGAALDASETLEQLGIEISPFGGDTVLISAYPAMLANLPPREVLRQVVDLLLAGGKAPQRRDVLDELLHMVSCKAAIKAGDRLAPDEVSALLAQRHLYQDTHHCPHGRPTALVFTREELDKRFKRV